MWLGVEDRIEQLGRRMIQRQMPEPHRAYFAQLPLLFVGTADAAGRPWVSALAGRPGFLRAIDAGVLRIDTQQTCRDPIHNALVEGAHIGSL